ncbi:MAG TPA: hypothetical protein VGE73_09315 [Pseudolabrys sp.]|jgi:hypothetical protein
MSIDHSVDSAARRSALLARYAAEARDRRDPFGAPRSETILTIVVTLAAVVIVAGIAVLMGMA